LAKDIDAGGVRVARYFVRAKESIWKMDEMALKWDSTLNRDATETSLGIDCIRVQYVIGRTLAADCKISPSSKVALRACWSEVDDSTMLARASKRPEDMRTVRVRDL
jgi:hypothetical protein